MDEGREDKKDGEEVLKMVGMAQEAYLQNQEMADSEKPIDESMDDAFNGLCTVLGEIKEFKAQLLAEQQSMPNVGLLREEMESGIAALEREKINHQLLSAGFNPAESADLGYSPSKDDSLMRPGQVLEIRKAAATAVSDCASLNADSNKIVEEINVFIALVSQYVESSVHLRGQLFCLQQKIAHLWRRLEKSRSNKAEAMKATSPAWVLRRQVVKATEELQECQQQFEELTDMKHTKYLELDNAMLEIINQYKRVSESCREYRRRHKELTGNVRELEERRDELEQVQRGYSSLLAELQRRVAVEEQVAREATQYTERLSEKFEEEVRRRNQFKNIALRYFPAPLQPLLFEQPLRYEVFPLKHRSHLYMAYLKDRHLFQRSRKDVPPNPPASEPLHNPFIE